MDEDPLAAAKGCANAMVFSVVLLIILGGFVLAVTEVALR